MKKMIKVFFANRSVEEIIFSLVLLAGVPYFTINEIIDLSTNRNWLIFALNISLLSCIIYLLYLNHRRKLTARHIFLFSLVLAIAFAIFWPSSTGLYGRGGYVLQSLMVVLLIVNTGRSKVFFAIFLVTMITIAGYANIDYTGNIEYGNQLVSFLLNTMVIALVMNLFKKSLERKRKRLVGNIGQLEKANQKLAEQKATLEENHKEIIRMQTQLQEIIAERTKEIEVENQRLIDYAFINAHLVRAPLANLIGLLEFKSRTYPKYDSIREKTESLDQVVRKIGGILAITDK